MKSWTKLFFIFLCAFSSVYCVVVSWGEKCEFTAECGDHRLVCEEAVVKNRTLKICVCDRYHEWNGSFIGCVQKYNSTQILDMIHERENIAERIEYEANVVFVAQIIAGLIVMGVGLICTIVVGIVCYHMYKEDAELYDLVQRLETQKTKEQPTTSQPTPVR